MKELSEKELRECVGGGAWDDIGQGVGRVAYWVGKAMGNMSDVNQASRINRKKKH